MLAVFVTRVDCSISLQNQG